MQTTAGSRRVVVAALVLGVLALTACSGTDADRQRSAQA